MLKKDGIIQIMNFLHLILLEMVILFILIYISLQVHNRIFKSNNANYYLLSSSSKMKDQKVKYHDIKIFNIFNIDSSPFCNVMRIFLHDQIIYSIEIF